MHTLRAHTCTGFSTIELLIAFSIALIILPPLFLLAATGEQSALDVTLMSEGIARAATETHTVLASTTPWLAVPPSFTRTPFTHHTVTEWVTPCSKVVSAHTEWVAHGTQVSDARITTLTTSASEAVMRGGCDPLPLMSEWESPQARWQVPSPNNTQGSDVVLIRDQGRIIAIVSAIDTTTSSSTPNLFAYDVTDRSVAPLLLTQIDTGPGIAGITTDGDTIYAAALTATQQLLTVRLFDRTKAAHEPGYYTFATTSATTLPSVAGAFPEARTIMYYDGVVHVGTWNNNLPTRSHEYHAFDVSTPSAPRFMGSLDIRHSVNMIDAHSGGVFLATTDDGGELTLIDASSTPHISARFDIPESTRDAETVHVVGTTAYLGLERGHGSHDVVAVDIANPRTPHMLGTASFTAHDTVRAFQVVGRRGFTGSDSLGFTPFDTAHAEAIRTTGCNTTLSGTTIRSLAYADQRMFASARGVNLLVVFDDDTPRVCE